MAASERCTRAGHSVGRTRHTEEHGETSGVDVEGEKHVGVGHVCVVRGGGRRGGVTWWWLGAVVWKCCCAVWFGWRPKSRAWPLVCVLCRCKLCFILAFWPCSVGGRWQQR